MFPKNIIHFFIHFKTNNPYCFFLFFVICKYFVFVHKNKKILKYKILSLFIVFKMKEIRKIKDNVYEIPQEEDMNVPGRLFVSENILNNLDSGSIEQVKNVSKLPGILKYSIGLPDMHVGYGFPIGGVAGFDASKSGEGVISPGGVGYDINCLEGDSKILTYLGYNKKIKDFKEDSNLSILDKGKKKLSNSGISLFMKK